jgi:hypothetical protein
MREECQADPFGNRIEPVGNAENVVK